jgi:hypothetical protein
MSYITQYSKPGNSTLYDVKVCNQNRCDVMMDQYKFVNGAPNEQMFPFPSTSDNKLFMVGERIVQDKNAFNQLVLHHAKKQQCFDIDPCDVYTSEYCCKPAVPEQKNQKNAITVQEEIKVSNSDDGITNLDLFIFFLVVILFIAVIATIFGFVMLN